MEKNVVNNPEINQDTMEKTQNNQNRQINENLHDKNPLKQDKDENKKWNSEEEKVKRQNSNPVLADMDTDKEPQNENDRNVKPGYDKNFPADKSRYENGKSGKTEKAISH